MATAAAPPPHRWVSAGGKLVVLGEGYTASTGWPMDPAGTVQYMGFGQVNLFAAESDQSRDAIVTLLGTHDPDSNQNTIPMLGPLRRATERIHNDEIWYGSEDADFNSAFPVIGGARAPVRLVIGVLTLFVRVARQSLFVNRKGRRVVSLDAARDLTGDQWIGVAMSFSAKASPPASALGR